MSASGTTRFFTFFIMKTVPMINFTDFFNGATNNFIHNKNKMSKNDEHVFN